VGSNFTCAADVLGQLCRRERDIQAADRREQGERIEKLEANQISQREYQELINRLDRIENKVDDLTRNKR
jgi:hypothetical protein